MGLFERARTLTDAATREVDQRVADLTAAAASASITHRTTISGSRKLAEQGLREESLRGCETSTAAGNLRTGFAR